MSAIATFIHLPLTSAAGVRDAAVPKKGWLGGTKDGFHEFLRMHGREVAHYAWSGYVLATLLTYLDERGIELMHSEHEDLSRHISEKRKTTCFVFTKAQKWYLGQLAPESFSEIQLRDYYNEFNATKEAEVGKAMLDGIRAIRDSLRSIEDDSFVLLSIG